MTEDDIVRPVMVHNVPTKEPSLDEEMDEWYAMLDADLEAQDAWRQSIDDDEAGLSDPPWEE